MRKIIIYFSLISTLFACKTNKNITVLKYEESDVLKFQEAFIQQEIPGTQREKLKTYITLIFSEPITDKVKLEKLMFVDEIYEIQKINYRIENNLKVDVTNSNFWNQLTIPEAGVKVYFKLENKLSVQKVTLKIRTEPIYLP